MKKSVLYFVSTLIFVVLAACSQSSPYVGEWSSLGDTNGNTTLMINSNGTVDLITDAEDGYIKVSGTWSEIDNILNLIFDSDTIEVDLDNPIMKEMMTLTLIEFAGQRQELVLSEDGSALLNKATNAKAFVRK